MKKLLCLFIIIAWYTMPMKAHHYNILVLPCGGAAGIIPIALLHHLEKHTGLPTTQLFNEIWGSSAGSISAALLTSPTTHTKKTKAVMRFFEHNFANYYRSYYIRDAVQNTIGSERTIGQANSTIRILTSASKNPEQGNWQLYDFSSDGLGSCPNTQLSLADIVKASCTVYPYLYFTPISLAINTHETRYCIDPGSLVVNPPTTDPTAYFLQQLLARLASDDSVTIYFLANAFTPSIDYHDVLEVLKKCASSDSYALYYDDDGTFGTQPQKQIEIVNIPVTTSCDEIFATYLHHANFTSRTTAKLLRHIFARVVGKENSVANLIAAGVVPMAELKKEARKIIRSSHNFAMLLHNFKKSF